MNKTEKKIKSIQIGKEEVKLALLIDIFLYVGNPKESTRMTSTSYLIRSQDIRPVYKNQLFICSNE